MNVIGQRAFKIAFGLRQKDFKPCIFININLQAQSKELSLCDSAMKVQTLD